VGSWGRGIKIPEEFERSRTGLAAGPVSHIVIAVLLGSGLAALAIMIFVRLLRGNEIPWRFALVAGTLAGLASAWGIGLITEKLWALQYQTSMPANLFPFTIVVVVVVWLVAMMLGVTLAVGLAGGLYPAVGAMFAARNRRVYAKDALIAGLVATGVALAIPALHAAIASRIPAGRLITGVDVPASLDARVPYLEVLLAVVRRTFWAPAVAAALLAASLQFFRSVPLRAALAIAAVFAFTPFAVRTVPELLVGALVNAVALAAGLLFARFFLRDNPLAWVWSCWLAVGVVSARALAGMSAPLYRNGGYLALAFVLAPGLVLALDAIAGLRKGTRPGAELP